MSIPLHIPLICGYCSLGPITKATIGVQSSVSEFRNINNLNLVIEGFTSGGEATSVAWTRNSNRIYPPERNIMVPGGILYIGGGEVICDSTSCNTKMYRVALLVRGRLPGVYRYTGTNVKTRTPLSRSITIQGENV